MIGSIADSERIMNLDELVKLSRSRIEPLERFVHAFAVSLGQPLYLQRTKEIVFRYAGGDVRHFCLLKAVRVVSALNASLILARTGYSQEMCTLMRTVAEFTTHIEFVTNPNNSEIHQREADAYVKAFFEDSGRDPAKGIKRAQVPQGVVHEAIGKTLDGFNNGTVPAAKLHSNIYRAYSNYVHGKYPEIMDLYGGMPGHFHLRGMNGTPKDVENFEILESFIITATNCMIMMIQRLNLRPIIQADAALANWYADFFKSSA
jgi:hypothetical protein